MTFAIDYLRAALNIGIDRPLSMETVWATIDAKRLLGGDEVAFQHTSDNESAMMCLLAMHVELDGGL
jgi:hypothetical protein